MDVSRPLELSSISEISIMQNARLVYKTDLNPVFSKENLRVQFDISGDLKGKITCHLCLDNHELSHADKNFYFPLFTESMNILVGKQISLDEKLSTFRVKLHAPKLSMIATEINTQLNSQTQKYDLILEASTFCVLVVYSLEALN